MKVLRLFLIAIALMATASCSNETSDSEEEEGNTKADDASEEVQPLTFTYKDQSFEIIPMYQQILDYTEYVNSAEDIDRKSAYSTKFFTPLEEIAKERDINMSNDYKSYFDYNTNIKRLAKNTRQLLEEKEKINSTIENALKKSAERMPGEDKTIFLLPMNPTNHFPIYNLGGMSGVALSEDVFIMKIDPSYEEKMLKYTAAHEYSHTVEAETNGGSWNTNLDLIISEGKAHMFAKTVYPDLSTPWPEKMTEKEENIVLDYIESNLGSFEAESYYTLEQGHRGEGVPVMANYRIGYQFISDYLSSRSEKDPREWMKLTPEEIISGTKYRYILENR